MVVLPAKQWLTRKESFPRNSKGTFVSFLQLEVSRQGRSSGKYTNKRHKPWINTVEMGGDGAGLAGFNTVKYSTKLS